MVRAHGSYPCCREFDSPPRYLTFLVFEMNQVLISVFLFTAVAVMPARVAFAGSNLDLFLGNPKHYQDVVVQKVLSGDTIVLETGETIRLIGVHAPPAARVREKITRDEHGFVVRERTPDIEVPAEQKAFEFVFELLDHQHVRLEFDVEKKDEEFTTLAYVFLTDSGIFVNEEILRQGYAQLRLGPPNMKYAEQLREAYQEARKEQRGILGSQ